MCLSIPIHTPTCALLSLSHSIFLSHTLKPTVSLSEAPKNVGENISERESKEERGAATKGAPSSKGGEGREGWEREGKDITLEPPLETSK